MTNTLGLDRFSRGDWGRARVLFEHSLALYRELGATLDSMMPLFGLGALQMARGDWSAGEEALEAHTAIALETGDLRLMHLAQTPLAERDVLEGRPEDGRRRLERVLALPGMSGTGVAAVLPVLAWTYLELGDDRRAEELAASAIARATAEDNQMALVEALRVQGIIRSQQGSFQEACRSFEEGLALLRRMKQYPYLLARLLYDWGSTDLENAEPMRARGRLEEALSIFRRLGARPYIERTERALAELEENW